MIEKTYKIFLLIGLSAILIFMPLARGTVRIWSVTLVMFSVTILIFLWLMKAINTKGYVFKRSIADIPMAIFIVLAVISFIFALYKNDSFYSLLKLFCYIAIFYLVLNEFDHNMRRAIVWLTIIIGSGISLYGLLQYFGFIAHPWWGHKNFISSTYVNHNHFAGYIELVIPATVGMVIQNIIKQNKRSWIGAFIIILTLVVMSAAFILSQSRGAWVSIAISFFIMNVFFARKGIINKRNFLLLIITILFIATFIYFGKERVMRRAATLMLSEDNTLEELGINRLRMYWGSLGMIATRPLTGWGIGNYIWAFTPFRPEGFNFRANYAHCDYLHMAAEMGVLAPFVMIWIFYIFVSTAIKYVKTDPVRFGCGMGLLTACLHNIVDFNFHIPANMMLFTVYAAIVMSPPEHRHHRHEEEMEDKEEMKRPSSKDAPPLHTPENYSSDDTFDHNAPQHQKRRHRSWWKRLFFPTPTQEPGRTYSTDEHYDSHLHRHRSLWRRLFGHRHHHHHS